MPHGTGADVDSDRARRKSRVSLFWAAGIFWVQNPREIRAADNIAAIVPDSPPIGAECIVYLRRDYIATYVKEETSGIEMVDPHTNTNFWRKYVNGTLLHLNEQWVDVKTPLGHEVWVPRAAVVAIDVGK